MDVGQKAGMGKGIPGRGIGVQGWSQEKAGEAPQLDSAREMKLGEEARTSS